MIPKIIHYCWFGGNEIPDEYKKYIETWQKYCPDYEIKEWNESNFNLDESTFAREAYEQKKWAFVSDYARLKVIYDEGGIYLDIDVEVTRNFDPLLSYDCFLGTEPSGFVNTGIGFGAQKKNPIIEMMLHQYDGHFVLSDGSFDMKPCPQKNTEILLNLGFVFDENTIWRKNNIAIFPPKYFCPLDYETEELHITEDTFSIHHFGASWHNQWTKCMHIIRKQCLKCFGKKTGGRVADFITLPMVVLNKLAELGPQKFFSFLIERSKKYFSH